MLKKAILVGLMLPSIAFAQGTPSPQGAPSPQAAFSANLAMTIANLLEQNAALVAQNTQLQSELAKALGAPKPGPDGKPLPAAAGPGGAASPSSHPNSLK